MERLVRTAECTGVYVVVQVSGLRVQGCKYPATVEPQLSGPHLSGFSVN